MPITVRDLLATPDLRLVLREPGGDGALDEPVRWIHQSELPDSTGFSEPGEVLITTGAELPADAVTESDDGKRIYIEYVQRLCDTSVVALGFGVGPRHGQLPQSLLTAARQAGLPVFEIPWEIPFSAVIKTVSQAQANAEQASLLRSNRAQRRLIAAVRRDDATHALIATTAQIIDGWAALTDAHGQVITMAGAVPTERLAPLAAAHQARGSASSFAAGVMVHTVSGQDREESGLLIAGRRRELDSVDQSSCLLAAQLLGVYQTMTHQESEVLTKVRDLLIRQALSGHPQAAMDAAGVAWAQVPPDPIVLTCVDGDPGELAEVPLADLRVVWGMNDRRLWIISSPAQRQRLADRLRRRALTNSMSEPCGWDDLPEVRRTTLAAVLGDGATAPGSFLDLLAPREARAFAKSVLGALTAPEFADLLTTMAAWLDASGSVERAAEELGVHRHTVRRRMERAAHLVTVDIDSPGGRHELWFACEVLRRDGHLPGPQADASSPDRSAQ